MGTRLYGGFPVIAEITRSLTKEISHASARGQYFNGNFCCKKLSASVFCHDRKANLTLVFDDEIRLTDSFEFSIYHCMSILIQVLITEVSCISLWNGRTLELKIVQT